MPSTASSQTSAARKSSSSATKQQQQQQETASSQRCERKEDSEFYENREKEAPNRVATRDINQETKTNLGAATSQVQVGSLKELPCSLALNQPKDLGRIDCSLGSCSRIRDNNNFDKVEAIAASVTTAPAPTTTAAVVAATTTTTTITKFNQPKQHSYDSSSRSDGCETVALQVESDSDKLVEPPI